jgi:Protein of unknown function (DUF1838)
MDRRTAIGLGVGAAAAMAMPSAAKVTSRRLDPSVPADAAVIYRKLRYRTDDGPVFSWVNGPYMAVIGGDLIQMYAINLGAIQQVTQRPDGGFDVRDLEISFRTDVDSGKRLETFVNPITKEALPIKVRPQGPNSVHYSRDNVLSLDTQPGGPHFAITHQEPKLFRVGDKVMIRDRSHAVVTMPDGAVSMTNEVSTISAPAAQVLDPAVTMALTDVRSNDVRSWPAWLRMGDRPGALALFAIGAKVQRFEDMPQDWLAMLHDYAPEIARDPIGALAKPPMQG